MASLAGKVALVTGGGTGIGRGIALALAAAGARVVIAARRDEPLKAVAAEAPDRIAYTTLDLARREDHDRALEHVVATEGRLDILVSNAGYQLWKPFLETTDEEIDDLFFTNTASTVRLLKRAVPHLQRSGGNIVIISSTASRYTVVPTQKLSVYGASKAALNQLTRTLAPELGPLGIRINAVAPGLTRAEYSKDSLGEDLGQLQWIRDATSLGRMGEPEDIAKVVLFLAGEQAAWVTGQVIDASGGWQISAG